MQLNRNSLATQNILYSFKKLKKESPPLLGYYSLVSVPPSAPAPTFYTSPLIHISPFPPPFLPPYNHQALILNASDKVTERERTRLSVQQQQRSSSVSAAVLMQEEENSLKLWSGGLKELVTMKTDISQYVMPTDTLLLHGQVEELHSQWEELCLKVSERQREKRGG